MVRASKQKWKLLHLLLPCLPFTSVIWNNLAEQLSTCLTLSISLRLFLCTKVGNFLLSHDLYDHRCSAISNRSFKEDMHCTLLFRLTDHRREKYCLGYGQSSCCVQPWGKLQNGQNTFRNAMAKLPEMPSSTGCPSFSCSIYTDNDWMDKWGRGREILNNMPGHTYLTVTKYEKEL